MTSVRDRFEPHVLKCLLMDIYQEVDGYYVWSTPGPGFMEASSLRAIADLLDEMNAAWDAEVTRALECRKNDLSKALGVPLSDSDPNLG